MASLNSSRACPTRRPREEPGRGLRAWRQASMGSRFGRLRAYRVYTSRSLYEQPKLPRAESTTTEVLLTMDAKLRSRARMTTTTTTMSFTNTTQTKKHGFLCRRVSQPRLLPRRSSRWSWQVFARLWTGQGAKYPRALLASGLPGGFQVLGCSRVHGSMVYSV